MLRRLPLTVLALAASFSAARRADAQDSLASAMRDSTREALRRHVAHLASSALGGRAAGTAGSDSTVQYLVRTYREMQVDPGARPQCANGGACGRGYSQEFRFLVPSATGASRDDTLIARNVIAMVPGLDDSLATEWIVIGAHHDHLGTTGMGALDANRRDRTAPHLGADDNASGTAAVLELARRIASSPLRRSVLFVHFDAEERGLFGSQRFVSEPPVALGAIVAVGNLDMIGGLRRDGLQAFGTSTSPDWADALARANERRLLTLWPEPSLGPRNSGSDHVPFARAGIPALHLFTGVHRAYHTRDDTAELVDYDGLVRVVEFTEVLLHVIGDATRRPARPRP